MTDSHSSKVRTEPSDAKLRPILRVYQRREHARVVTRHPVLKRKDRASFALSTLFKHDHAPHSSNNTPSEKQHTVVSNSKPDSQASIDEPVWPPDGLNFRSHLTPEDAQTLIASGALFFEGFVAQADHIIEEHKRYFAFADTSNSSEDPKRPATSRPSLGQSLVLGANVDSDRPWETLEQPSMSLCFGSVPGSITLNRYVGSIARRRVDQTLLSSVTRREMTLQKVLERLCYLRGGLDDDPAFAQKYLYRNLVYDQAAVLSEPPDIERQIFALAEVLNSPRWFDFQRAEDQTVASYFYSEKETLAHIFFHQLMLSMQLLMNIQESDLSEDYQRMLFSRLPERVAWSVAMAQLWRENCSIQRVSRRNQDRVLGPFTIRLHSRTRQLDMLWNFASQLKWPRMENVEDTLQERDHPLEERSFMVMTLLSGLVVPGNFLSWALMGSLIDCDVDASRFLKGFTSSLPSFGFQYHRSSYWYWECIVAKVMAAAQGVNQVAGWVGPVPYSSNLALNQCAAINQYRPYQTVDQDDIENMLHRSDARGPEAEDYPVREFGFPMIKTDAADNIRFQRLEFKPAEYDSRIRSIIYDACVVFTVRGFFTTSIPIRLRYNVSFISAPPCKSGPHILHRTYAPVAVPVDRIWRLNFWSGCCVCPLDMRSENCKHRVQWPELFNKKEILVVQALGRQDNDVFARAWCSYMGLSAVIADRKTCVACAVRNAVAAKVWVVILIDGKRDEEKRSVSRRRRRYRRHGGSKD
ncbi:MAG: hypothetical protein Q9191_001107 [Dirinaria sp. TL-2023a]